MAYLDLSRKLIWLWTSCVWSCSKFRIQNHMMLACITLSVVWKFVWLILNKKREQNLSMRLEQNESICEGSSFIINYLHVEKTRWLLKKTPWSFFKWFKRQKKALKRWKAYVHCTVTVLQCDCIISWQLKRAVGLFKLYVYFSLDSKIQAALILGLENLSRPND